MKITFPFNGIHTGGLPGSQPSNTSPRMQNVRPYWAGRLRGGQRPGMKKWSSILIGGAEQPVVAICSVSAQESP